MTLTAEWINRFEQFGKVNYDLIFYDNVLAIKHRFNISFDLADDTQAKKDETEAAKRVLINDTSRTQFTLWAFNLTQEKVTAAVAKAFDDAKAEVIAGVYGLSN